jgi:hypothetical protein
MSKNGARSAATLTMNLKNAAFLALTGTVLVTLLMVFSLIGDLLGVARGVVPAMRLVTSFIYAFAGFSVVVFLYVFHAAQV